MIAAYYWMMCDAEQCLSEPELGPGYDWPVIITLLPRLPRASRVQCTNVEMQLTSSLDTRNTDMQEYHGPWKLFVVYLNDEMMMYFSL